MSSGVSTRTGWPHSSVRSKNQSASWDNPAVRRRREMSVARVTELSVTSNKSFEDAIQQGVQRATKTLRNVRSAWIKEQEVKIEGNGISEYQVTMLVTFVLDD